jgi:hypothetical protein
VESTSRQSALSKLAATVDLEGAALGLQMAISVVVVLFLALVIRLEYPTWAVFTVLMLCMANYVGAVQEKAVLRIIGTIIGGALGFLATGALQQSPMLYLPLTFIVVAFSVSMFGQSRAPYAFFLAGMTYVVIASNSQIDPAMASHYALLRIEEVGLGVVPDMPSPLSGNWCAPRWRKLPTCFHLSPAGSREQTPISARSCGTSLRNPRRCE